MAQAPALLHVHEDWMRTLERRGLLNRELEALPSRREVAGRIERGEGLTAPELSVLLSYTKIVLADELLESDLPDDPFLRGDLFSYFPSQDAPGLPHARWRQHPLRREIVVTQLVNQLVNHAGMTYFHRLSGETAASAAELTLAQLPLPGDLRRQGGWAGEIAVVRQPDRRRACRPGCASRCAPWSSGPAAGW